MRDLLWLANRLFLAAVLFTVTAAVANGDQATSPTVSLTGTLNSKSITQDELLRFTVTVENKGSETLKDLRLAAPPDGYRWLRIHTKSPAGTDVYYSDSVEFEDVHNVVFPSVPPGATFTAWGYLLPNVSHKAATLAVEAEWTTGAGKTSVPTFSAPVELGENTVQGEGDILWGYVTILALPVVLALLPFAVNSILRRRDDRSETLRLMLTQSLEYAAKYYLPLSAAAQRLVQSLEPPPAPGQTQSPPNALACFYYVIYLEKRMTEQRKAVGGFYFKDLRAEKLASLCWKKYSDAIFGQDPTDQFNRSIQACVNKLKDRENFDAFAKKLEMNQPGVFAHGDAQRAWQLFKPKLDSLSITTLILELNTLQALIDYEVNRPFENWYPTAQPPLTVDAAVKQRLQELSRELHFSPEEREYVDSAEVLPVTE
jgi:hypothetical protein